VEEKATLFGQRVPIGSPRPGRPIRGPRLN